MNAKKGARWGALLGFASVACGGGSGPGSQEGEISTWAGDGTQGYAGEGVHRSEIRMNQPMELTFADDGTGYLVDWNNHSIRTIDVNGTVELLIGRELPGDWPCQDPENASNCEVPLDGAISGADLALNHPMDVAIDEDGMLVIAAWHNHKVEQCEPASVEVTVLAGRQKPGFVGDGGPAGDALLFFPDSIVIDEAGARVVSDQKNNRIRRIAKDGSTVQTVAGAASLSGHSGDGGPASEAELALSPYDEAGGVDNPPPGGGMALGGDGTLYFADSFNHCIRAIDPGPDGIVGEGDSAEEVISVVAGKCGESGFDADGGAATKALFHSPHDVDFGPDGRLYVADVGNHVIWAVDLERGMVERIAGTGEPGFSGDGGDARDARLRYPYGTAFDADGHLYILDTRNNRIRKVAREAFIQGS